MIVVDASVLIGHLDASDGHHRQAVELFLALAGLPVRASVVTLAEVFVGPARVGRLAEARQAVARLGVETVPLGKDADIRLARLRAETGLRLPDCCVLLAAQERAGSVRSFDERLTRAAQRLGLAE